MKTLLRLTSPLVILLLAVVSCSEPTSPAAAPRLRGDAAAPPTPSYTIIDLGTLGGAAADARAINDVGQVVGASRTASGQLHAFLWTAADGMKDLGTLGGNFSRAFAINHLGHVAGMSALPSGERRPFLWTPAGGMQDLGTFGGGFGRARSINDQDQVVGVSDVPSGDAHAFLWTAAQGLTDLVNAVGNNSEVDGINNRQQLVGGSNFNGPANQFCGFTVPFLWSAHAGFQSLGQLGTADPCGGAFTNATNENDVAVGGGETDAFVLHAFRWMAKTGIVDIGTLAGANGTSVAQAVNASGQIVGSSTTADGTTSDAALWDDGGIHDLGRFSGDGGSTALGINGRGQIVGISFSNHNRAVLWTPHD